ncbi:PEP-CTERM sorting domain-containing protein [Cerasicoccus maritimus]|uniref:PEP-CTERM sorting domain-containing protein n=1 Tax=Cerasicoccus maritimus TaxID=490089 RepID=UPI0028528A24|nr:PEP-CTERM sorting domain-containing protein [Cerasicoccus maritimus]
MKTPLAIASGILLTSSTFAASALWDGYAYGESWTYTGAGVGWVDGGSNTTVPNGVDDVAQFDNNSFYGSGGNVYLATDAGGAGSVFNVTLGRIELTATTSGRGFDLRSPTAGTPTLTFDVSSGNASIDISAPATANEGIVFDVNVQLNDSLDVSMSNLSSGTRDGVNFNEIVSGTGAINKSGFGLMRFAGTAGYNTFSGGVNISNGIVYAAKDGALGTGTVTVAQSAVDSTATLEIITGVTDAIDDSASLYLGSFSGNFSTITLGDGVNETVAGLFFDSVGQSAGTWGATGSGATNINDDWFTGTGMLTVIPEPSTYAFGVAALALIVAMIRRRQ